MQKQKRKSLLNKIALSLIFSLGLFSLFSLLGTVRAAEISEEEKNTEEQNAEEIDFGEMNMTEEIIPEEEVDQTGMIKYDFSPAGIFVFENDSNGASILMANIALENTKIISQDGNRFKVSFDIVNKNSWTQNNIRYKVALSPVEFFTKASPPLSKDEGSKTEIFFESEKLYPEKISLKKNSRINKVIEYEAPAYLFGDYLLFVGAYLPVGFSFPSGMKIFTETPISLKGDSQFIEIIPSSCQFFTEERSEEKQEQEQEQEKENSNVESDFQKEGQVAICEAINHFKESVKVTPYFEIYQRSEYGEKIKEFVSNRGEFHFEPGEKQNISFNLPVDLDPQSYNAKIVLRKNEEIVSNQIALDYTVQGLSATIQNVTFDKNSYEKGETAKVRLFWSDAPKLFEKRANIEYLKADLTFKNGTTDQICGQITKELDVKKTYEEIVVPLTADCPDPIILASLKNKEDKILFQQESQILEEMQGSKLADSKKSILNNKNYILGFALVALSVVILSVLFILFFKTKKIKK